MNVPAVFWIVPAVIFAGICLKAWWDTRGPSAYSEAAQLERLAALQASERTLEEHVADWYLPDASRAEINAVRLALIDATDRWNEAHREG